MKTAGLTLATLLTGYYALMGFAEIGRGELFMETQFLVQQDNNITGNNFKASDTIYSLFPNLRFQQQGRGDLSASVGVSFVRFEDFDQFDSEDLNTQFRWELPAAAGSPFSSDIDLSYVESTDVDEFVNDRITSERTYLRLNGAYRLRQRLSVRGNLLYNDRNSVGYSSLREKSGTVGVIVHDIWQDVGLTADYRTRRLTTTGDIINRRNDKDDAIFVGLTGQILPENIFNRLEAYISLSYQEIDSTRSGGADQDLIGYDGKLSWEARPTTKVSLVLSKDLFLTVNDEIIKYQRTALELEQQFSRLTSGTLSLGFNDVEYTDIGRTDDRFEASASLSRVLGRNWSAGLNVIYQSGDSTTNFFDFNRFVSNIFTTFRF